MNSKTKSKEVFRPTLTADQVLIVYESITGCADAELISKFSVLAFKINNDIAKPAYIKSGTSKEKRDMYAALSAEEKLELATKEGFDEDAFMKELEQISNNMNSKDIGNALDSAEFQMASLNAALPPELEEYAQQVDILNEDLSRGDITQEEYQVKVRKYQIEYGITD